MSKLCKALKVLIVLLEPIKEIEVINKRGSNKPHCIPTHLNDEEALHVHEQAYERQWSNSAYIRHLIREDRKRYMSELYLNGDCDENYTELLKHSVRNEKSPSAGTDEPDVQHLRGN